MISCDVLLLPWLTIILVAGAYSGLHERMLLEDLLAYYNKLERPVANESEAVVLTFGLTLQQIIDVVIILGKIIYFIFHIYDTKGDLEFPLLAVLKLNYFILSNKWIFFRTRKIKFSPQMFG